MLDESIRSAVLVLHGKGRGMRSIAKTLGVSRTKVREVIRSGRAEVPRISRSEKAEPWRKEILEEIAHCKGNLVRVHEELVARGAKLSYPALTAFCRRHGIGHEPKAPTGRYEFGPGVEMQHDTSPHVAKVGGRDRKVQTASLVLCYSHMLYFQLFPAFTRFECKVFLSRAASFFGGNAARCMVDNTSVIRSKGTGANMVPSPEMAALAERYGYAFIAHEVGDADRSAYVEAPFSFIENNFLAGREFADFADANRQAAAWCDKVNRTYKKHIRAVPYELFVAERPRLKPLPAWVPEIYQLHHRLVDLEGYVSVHSNRYSAPYQLIGRSLEVRESYEHMDLYDGPRRVAHHERVIDPCGARVTDLKHRPPRGEGRSVASTPAEEGTILATAPELGEYVAALKRRDPGRGTQSLRRLLRLIREYPREPLLAAVKTAAHYGLYDLGRLESIVLRNLASEFFLLDATASQTQPRTNENKAKEPTDD